MKVTETQVKKAEAIIRAWFKKQGYADIGDALLVKRQWMGDKYSSHVTFIYEGYYEWALEFSGWGVEENDKLEKIGLFAEPYAGWALNITRND